MDLTIWFKNGKTAHFKGVTQFNSGARILEFYYVSAFTGQKRNAAFARRKLAGVSITEEE